MDWWHVNKGKSVSLEACSPYKLFLVCCCEVEEKSVLSYSLNNIWELKVDSSLIMESYQSFYMFIQILSPQLQISASFILLLIHLSSGTKRSSIYFFLNIYFPTSLEIFDWQQQQPPWSLCKHEFTGCCAGTFGDLLSGYWDLFIFWWTGKLWGCGPCQVSRYQLKKPCWKNCGWHCNIENDQWCIIYF